MTRPKEVFDEQIARLAILLHELHAGPDLAPRQGDDEASFGPPAECSVDHVDQATRLLEMLRHVH
jgi:hypothetical protein